MTALLFPVIFILVYFIFSYFIDIKRGTLSSFIARLILCELFLFFIHLITTIIVEKVFSPWVDKDLFLGILSIWGFLAIVFILLVFFFFIFVITTFLILISDSLPEITYCAKIAPFMSLIAEMIVFILLRLVYDFEIYSIIFTAFLMLILTPLVFADRDYQVKLDAINQTPDIFEMSPSELKESCLQRKEEIALLNQSYRRNIIVRFNREL